MGQYFIAINHTKRQYITPKMAYRLVAERFSAAAK